MLILYSLVSPLSKAQSTTKLLVRWYSSCMYLKVWSHKLGTHP